MDMFKEAGEAAAGFWKDEFFPLFKKFMHLFLWALSAIVVLPCVFVTHHLYPLWEEWGKEF